MPPFVTLQDKLHMDESLLNRSILRNIFCYHGLQMSNYVAYTQMLMKKEEEVTT